MGLFPPLFIPTYITVNAVRRAAKTLDQSTNDDDILLWIADDCSRKIEQYTRRQFFPRHQTIKVDWPSSYELDLPDDLLSLTTLTNGDGNIIYDTEPSTGVQNIFYYAQDQYPRYKIQLGIQSGKVFLFVGTPQQSITLDAIWGYPAYENTGQYYVSTAATVQDTTQQSASQTTLLTQTGNFYAGQMLLIGSEYELIQSVSVGTTNDTLTVLRAACGSTAAAHANGTAIYQILVHPVIVRAAWRIIQWSYEIRSNAMYGTSSISGMGEKIVPLSIPEDVKDDLNGFIRGHR
jgi:hypothetical protein